VRWRPTRAEAVVIAVITVALIAVLVPRPQMAGSGAYGIRAKSLTITDGDGIRDVILCTSRASDEKRLPLVLAFHGVGDSPRSMLAYSKLDKLVGHGRCSVAFLEGRRAMWVTEGRTDAPLSENRDVRFVCAVLAELPKHVRFDESRVYAVGMSNGATFAEMLSLALPCRIAAVAAHSGGLRDDILRANDARRVPLLFIVGEYDSAADWVRETATNFDHTGHNVELIIRPDLEHEWDPSQNEAIWSFLRRHRLPEDCNGAAYGEPTESRP